VYGSSLRAVMSSIVRCRSGPIGLVSFIGWSFLSEVERPSILRTGLPVAPGCAIGPLPALPPHAPAQAGRSGATSCAGAFDAFRLRSLFGASRPYWADWQGPLWVGSDPPVTDGGGNVLRLLAAVRRAIDVPQGGVPGSSRLVSQQRATPHPALRATFPSKLEKGRNQPYRPFWVSARKGWAG
jgi:hypothetical protein